MPVKIRSLIFLDEVVDTLLRIRSNFKLGDNEFELIDVSGSANIVYNDASYSKIDMSGVLLQVKFESVSSSPSYTLVDILIHAPAGYHMKYVMSLADLFRDTNEVEVFRREICRLLQINHDLFKPMEVLSFTIKNGKEYGELQAIFFIVCTSEILYDSPQ